MTIKYFNDTDTTLINFTTGYIAETREISETIYIDIDVSENLVNITIEHAKRNGTVPEIHYLEMNPATLQPT